MKIKIIGAGNIDGTLAARLDGKLGAGLSERQPQDFIIACGS